MPLFFVVITKEARVMIDAPSREEAEAYAEYEDDWFNNGDSETDTDVQITRIEYKEQLPEKYHKTYPYTTNPYKDANKTCIEYF